MDFQITGVVRFWPTLCPDTERFFIVNVDYLFDQIGGSPYDVWAQTDGTTPPAEIVNELRERDFIVSRFVDARETALRLRDDPGRTGIFGILTVGFIVAALLTVLGFMLYSFLSAKRRMQQLGILRAMGLSIPQLITSDHPDPSVVGVPLPVAYVVNVIAPGAGTPTGNITITDGVDSCTGTIAAGTCNLTLTTVGGRLLTATYLGDANFGGSTSLPEPHTVAGPPAVTLISSFTR